MKRRNVEGLTRWLIQHAARSGPPSLAQRLEEEWLADLEARHGTLARLRFGLGCCWATRVIAYELGESKVLATGSAAGNKVMAAYAQHDDPFFSRRTLTLLLIAGLHVGLFFAFTSGLARGVIAAMPDRLIGVFMEQPRHVTPPPPPLEAPQVTAPRFREVPWENPRIDDTFVETVTDVRISDSYPPQPPTAQPQKVVNRVSGGPGKGFPTTDDFYPPVALRNSQSGAVTLRTCVDAKGRLTEAPTIAESSGYASLDAGALSLAKAGSGHYRPSTEDGLPVSSCYPLRIRFQLKK